MIDIDKVKKVASLARLYINEEDAQAFQKQFSKILDYFETLQKLDTSGVEPMRNPNEEYSPFREDRVEIGVSVTEIMANAPDKKGALFKVPPVV